MILGDAGVALSTINGPDSTPERPSRNIAVADTRQGHVESEEDAKIEKKETARKPVRDIQAKTLGWQEARLAVAVVEGKPRKVRKRGTIMIAVKQEVFSV